MARACGPYLQEEGWGFGGPVSPDQAGGGHLTAGRPGAGLGTGGRSGAAEPSLGPLATGGGRVAEPSPLTTRRRPPGFVERIALRWAALSVEEMQCCMALCAPARIPQTEARPS
jgi:hypothetical protein